MHISNGRKAYIIGSGIAGMAAAAYLISDGGMKGDDITILDERPEAGGSFDGRGSAEKGYFCTGFRMFEKTIYQTTYDLLDLIPSLVNPKKTLKDDFFDFNKNFEVNAKARLVARGKVLDASRLELNLRDRFRLVKLLYLSEKAFEKLEIQSYFSTDFFKSNFWFEWATTFAFEPWHSLVEMRRYLCRAVHVAPKFSSMNCVLSAPYSEQDFFISPLQKWLKTKGVKFQQNHKVNDIEFTSDNNKKTVTCITLDGWMHKKISVKSEDLVFLTNGSMTADASVGSMEKPPAGITKKSDAWNLWKNLAGNNDDLGNPEVFCGSPDKSKWESFTLTFKNSEFFDLLEKLSGNKAGTNVLTTLKESNWLMTLAVPAQPYFINQPENTFVCWGYGLLPDKIGNHIKKKMSDCSGSEILEEVSFHLGFEKQFESIQKNTVCIPAMLPYITSQFMPRTKGDRPEVVPPGYQNFACIGQFVEIPEEIVFTVECSIRSSKIAVKKLLYLQTKIPPIYQGKYSIGNFIRSIGTILK